MTAKQHASLFALVFALLSCLAPAPLQASLDQLQTYTTQYYTISTDLSQEEAVPFGQHMDAVFAEYLKRFSGYHNSAPGPMALYLFQTHEEYTDFLKQHGINAANTGGMFFVVPRLQGLATWVHGKPYYLIFAVLQHEGFHQFAYHYIGPDLPNWVNEGIAQYFEDAILVGDKFYTGLANARRVASVKEALADNRIIDFDRLLQLSREQWHAKVIMGGNEAIMLYDQSWSMVYFLIHGDNGKYRQAFETYLMLVSKRTDSATAFRQAFGAQDTDGFRHRWEMFVRNFQPDPVNLALDHMEFLGSALKYLQDQGRSMPQSMEGLRDRMQAMRFVAKRTDQHGLVTRITASDGSLYRFVRPDGTEPEFELLPPEADDLLPRITAPGLQPQPTVVWWRWRRSQAGAGRSVPVSRHTAKYFHGEWHGQRSMSSCAVGRVLENR